MEKIVGIELNHQNAPLEIREKASLEQERISEILKDFETKNISAIIISTCNRLSLYAYASDLKPLYHFFAQFGDLTEYLNEYEGIVAVKKLFSTAAGIESQAIGEHQILGQVKQAFLLAKGIGCTSSILNMLFQSAIHTGKRVRGETSIGQFSTSIAAVAFDLVKNKFGDVLDKKNILVIGTGEMSQIFLKLGAKSKLGKLTVASRDKERGAKTAALWNAESINFDGINDIIKETDIVIGATDVITPFDFSNLVLDKKERLFVDLGLPRNFDNQIKVKENVNLYDLDDIKFFSEESFRKRQNEIPKAEMIIQEELDEFSEWLTLRKHATPVISSYWQQLEALKQEELDWILPKLEEASDENRAILIERLLHRVIRKVSKTPIEQMKTYAQHNGQNAEVPMETVKKIFNLKEENE